MRVRQLGVHGARRHRVARRRRASRVRVALSGGRRALPAGRRAGRSRRRRTCSASPRWSRGRTSASLVSRVQAARARRPAARARRRRRLGRAAEPRPPRDRPARVRRRRRARTALPRRLGLRLPVAIRGLRDPDRRGDGERRAGRRLVARVDGRGRRRRSLARRPGAARGDRGRARRARSPTRSRSSSAASPTPRASPGSRRAVPSSRAIARRRMRVGLDVSPLDQTQAGTARYLQSLEAVEGVDLVRLAHHGRSRADTLYRDGVWYPLVLPRLARRERLDVLHCPTFRGPLAPPSCPLVVTVHDLAVLRHPETFNRWTRHYSRLCRLPGGACGRARDRRLRAHEAGARRAARDLPEEKIRVVPNGVSEIFSPDGPAERRGLRAGRRHARAAQEPRPARRGDRSARRRAPRRRRRRLGRRRLGGRACAGSAASRTRSSLARLYRGAPLPRLPVALRGLRHPDRRGDGERNAGRHVTRRRDGRGCRRRGGAGRSARPGLDRCGHRGGGSAGATSSSAAGLERARAFDWRETARKTVEVYREAAA